MSVRVPWTDGAELTPTVGASAPPEPFAPLLRTAVRCNNAHVEGTGAELTRSGDPSESALLVAALTLDLDVAAAQRDRERVRRRVFHFDPHLKRMTRLDEEADGTLWYHAKGAPLELLERCRTLPGAAGERPLSGVDRERVRAAFAMTWAGIVACQLGAAFAIRASHVSLRELGWRTNPQLLRGIAFALTFAALIVYVPPLQSVFGTAPLPLADLGILACFPVLVWGSDELWRAHERRAGPAPLTAQRALRG